MDEAPLFVVPTQPLESDERYTPAWVFDALGVRFDLDVCAPDGGPLHVPAAHWHTAESDGLRQPWHGLVWMNPPYSNTTPWADRFIEHGNGVALVPYANSAWRVRLVAAADSLFLPADFPFIGQTHEQKHCNMPLLFVAMGPHAGCLAGLVGRIQGRLVL